MTNVIEIKNLSFSYSKEKKVLDNLSATIKEGQITSILGKNGSGKSTLLHLLTGNLKYSNGEIIYKEKNINSFSSKELAKNIAVVFQKNDIPEEITVYDLVSFGRLPYQNILFPKLSNEDKKHIDFALECTNLISLKNNLVSTLSGGELQRVFIALAISQGTKTIILDEPTTFLDVNHQKNTMELIKKLNKEHNYTVIMVLHDINQALTYSDNIIALAKGKIIKYGKANEFLNSSLLEEIYDINLKIVDNVVISW